MNLAAPDDSEPWFSIPSATTLGDLKRIYVDHVLARAGQNKTRAAEILGIDRRTLYRILERQKP